MTPDTTRPDGAAAPAPRRARALVLLGAGALPLLAAGWWLSLGRPPVPLPDGLRQALLDAAGFFVLIGVELAVVFIGVSVLLGLLQEYVPMRVLKRILPDGVRGAFVAAGIGGLTPFCSCSTIPVMVGMMNAGVGFGPAAAFLIASPLVNPVVLSLFWLAFGWPVAVLYGAVTLVAAALSGLLWDRLGLAGAVRPVRLVGQPAETAAHGTLGRRLAAGLVNALGVFRAFVPYLLLGALIGAFIYGFVPADWVATVAGGDNPLSVPLAALIGVPLYIRADTMIPVGLALHQKGMGMGAIIALVIGGAGISIPEMILLSKIFRPRLLLAFAGTIFVVATAAGLFFGAFFA
ncbi:MAG TPA: permease [Azospirillum sp.]|nr:permease [Azospirillum sp.]